MLKSFIRRRIAAFERANNYDMSYAREILDTDLAAFLTFSRIARVGQYRKSVPPEAWYAAALVGTLAEDCGPCTQLMVTRAEREGIPAALLAAVLTGDEQAMPDAVLLAVRFARAVLAHDRQADDLRREVVARFGRRAVVALAFAITAARLFPTVKYALGYGHACTRVQVGGAPLPVIKRAA